MEFKKKTLIWETNTEPPKNYIWIKEDGKAYEYNNVIKNWTESNTISVGISDKQKIQYVEDYLGATLEDYFGITLEPNIDEKYYQYFTIEATEDDTVVYFRQSSYAVSDGIAPLKVEVSTDDGETWQEITAAPAEDDVPGTEITTLGAGDKILVRGDNEAYGYYSSSVADTVENCNFWANKNCYVYGNIMSLISRDNFARLRKVKEWAFAYFFSDYDGDLSSWILSKEEEMLLLPATTLAKSCYESMFYNCTGLTAAPELPATTLAQSCYNSMFHGCTSLTSAPELPATTLASYCYFGMFSNCTSLEVTPELPATTLADNCYREMFKNCTGLTTAPELPATTLATRCYYSMFHNCTGLTTAPVLSATALADYCYYYMFNGCTSLTTAPELPATTLAQSCYGSMFNGCTNLNHIKAMFTTTPGAAYTQMWVVGVSQTGTFVKNSAATWNVTSVNGIPIGWTVETADA